MELPGRHAGRPPGTAPGPRRSRGRGIEVFTDYECPSCAVLWARLREQRPRPSYRHFPIAANNHPRAWAAACAAEAAREQDAFWAMHDLLFADQGRLDDPHLWDRARRLGLDVARFDADRRSAPVRARVQADVDEGRARGVTGTPAVFE